MVRHNQNVNQKKPLPYASCQCLFFGCVRGAAAQQAPTQTTQSKLEHCADFAAALVTCAGLPADVLFIADLRALNPDHAGDPDVRVEDVVLVLAAHPAVPIVFGNVMYLKDPNGKTMFQRKGGLEFATLQLLGKLFVLLRVTADGEGGRAGLESSPLAMLARRSAAVLLLAISLLG